VEAELRTGGAGTPTTVPNIYPENFRSKLYTRRLE